LAAFFQVRLEDVMQPRTVHIAVAGGLRHR
jgi:hypothetical protein